MFFRPVLLACALALVPMVAPVVAHADDDAQKAKAVKDEGGQYLDAEGNPTFKINGDTVDYYTYAGYIRYHSDCHVCHGPDAMGSTYAPALKDSMKHISYADFLGIVAGGKKDLGGGKEKVMPAFGNNKNVYCYMDALYVYLRARAVGDMPRGRPPHHEDKPQAAKDHEKECMGS
ncbi:c-type cytochrome, methanol metabolism-related [Mesorhizobium koreense]|uniref:c-type cytochrome, methanol metabolism-related n=1 Tax=Mesorhizobium koreense TaxID=3074855 RepID=UPI00287B7E45|nr:c-type cytochrome, methanol metabolism-related [Mesorhizobium sp. WR6]